MRNRPRRAGQTAARLIAYAFVILATAWITATIVGYLAGGAAHMIVQ